MSEKSLTPYLLTFGPVLLVGAFLMWPASDAVGSRGTQSLVDGADTLMPLLIAAFLGTTMILGGLYLLISEMMENTGGIQKQLLGIASMLVIVSMVSFTFGLGSNVFIVNEYDRVLDATNETTDDGPAYVDEADRADTLENGFDTGATVWQMSPVTWGLSLILIGLVSYMMRKPEGAIDFVLPALMPVGTMFLSVPIINNPALFNALFPLTLLAHIIVGGLMLAGMIEVPGSSQDVETTSDA